MQKGCLYAMLIFATFSFAQQSDFSHINFTKADQVAKSYKSRRLSDLNKITYNLTKDLDTDVEKLRAIYIWICNNVANDYSLYVLNDKKRKKFENDSLGLIAWNSKFKKLLFKKLIRRKKTICTGYAYLLKEMCTIADIDAIMINGYGRTSDLDLDLLKEPNHTWNVVKLNDKWYLCDPTWATGIFYPEEGRFDFDYDNGYFLTEPKVFFQNHYPMLPEYALLGLNVPSFQEFKEMPLLYADAYSVLQEHVAPNKMHHQIQEDSTFTFKYQLKTSFDLDTDKIKFIFSNGTIETTKRPKINLQDNLLTLQQEFQRKGFYDVHLYFDNQLIATYTFKVIK